MLYRSIVLFVNERAQNARKQEKRNQEERQATKDIKTKRRDNAKNEHYIYPKMLLPLLLIPGAAAIPAARLWFNRKISEEGDDTEHDIVSSRGRRALSPPLPYLGAFFQALQDPCNIETNPEGRIALCVAENKLILKELSSRLSQYQVAKTAFVDEANYCYNDMRGMMHVRESVARFLTRKFLKPEKGNDSVVNAEHVILGSGCAGLLNGLFLSLLEEGEAVLIPAPYYAAFESDMKIVAQCVPLKVSMADPSAGPTADELEAGYTDAAKRRLKVKMLLLTNPNNPLGTIYSADTIKNSIDWARSRNVHTVVDEIYGLSVHDVSCVAFFI